LEYPRFISTVILSQKLHIGRYKLSHTRTGKSTTSIKRNIRITTEREGQEASLEYPYRFLPGPFLKKRRIKGKDNKLYGTGKATPRPVNMG
jgi:hypothetical protein